MNPPKRLAFEDDEPPECAICTDPVWEGWETRCLHRFHAECLETWLERRENCPVCRKDVSQHDVNKDYFYMKILMPRNNKSRKEKKREGTKESLLRLTKKKKKKEKDDVGYGLGVDRNVIDLTQGEDDEIPSRPRRNRRLA